MFIAGVKLAAMFIGFTAILVGTFYFGMPKVDPYVPFSRFPVQLLTISEDREVIKLPRSFADLQALK